MPDHCLMMATRSGLVKKTLLSAYSRPKRGGIKAIKLRDEDELVDMVLCKAGDEVVLATAGGMAIRFRESDARPMGRDTSGVKGIKLAGDDTLVGMVVADPDATLLTICENGFGKRTLFGPNIDDLSPDDPSSAIRYRTQKRGGKGIRGIRTTKRNGKVIATVRVNDNDEIVMMSRLGQIQRISVSDINTIGRATQGVRIMRLDKDDRLAAVVRVPPEQPNGNGDQPEGGDEQQENSDDA